MFGGHFYNASIRRMVSVFGTLFNNINVVRKTNTGDVKAIQRVPLAYGPKQKFLARLDERPDLNAPDVGIKLPRMSFEITSLVYDPSVKTSRLNRISKESGDGLTKNYMYTSSPYKIGFELSIMAKNQDDALQIIEQIVPYFQPDYTVTINDVPDMNIKSDVPIVLQSVGLSDSYDGDFLSRRAIVYTLAFEARVKFFGPIKEAGVIKSVTANIGLTDNTESLLEKYNATINPLSAQESEAHTIDEEFVFAPQISEIIVKYKRYDGTTTRNGDTIPFDLNEYVIGSVYSAQGLVTSVSDEYITISAIDGFFRVGEYLNGSTSTASWEIESIILT